MKNLSDVEHNLRMAKMHVYGLKSYLDWLKENDFTLDDEALCFVYELSKKLDEVKVAGGIIKP